MIGWIVLSVIAFIAWRLWSSFNGSNEASFAEPQSIEVQDFTPLTLQKFNGRDDARVLMGVKGKVFDVTNGKAHYGPGGPYANFAGRDASRGLAKHSFDEDMLTPLDAPIDTLSDLLPDEQDSLDQWATFFEKLLSRLRHALTVRTLIATSAAPKSVPPDPCPQIRVVSFPWNRLVSHCFPRLAETPQSTQLRSAFLLNLAGGSFSALTTRGGMTLLAVATVTAGAAYRRQL